MLKPVPIRPVLSVTELYTLYYFHHNSGYRFAGESHDFWEIIYVDKGMASGLNGPEPYTLEKGQVIFHHPNVFHNFRTGGPTEEDILRTIYAGANAITYTPPTTGTLFSELMRQYRGKFSTSGTP